MIHNTYGATIISKNFIKLVPPVPYRAGEVTTGIKNFMDEFRADVKFQIKNTDNHKSYGFAMWYLNALKEVNDRKGNLFGIKGDYSGLGIFLYRTIDGNWILHGNFNRGMDEYKVTSDKIKEDNACTILGDVENTVRSIRFEKSHKQVTVYIQDTASEHYAKCFSLRNDGLEYKGYFAFSADNFDEQHVNDIDIYSLNIYNLGEGEINKSVIDDRQINPDVKDSQDLLHKYKRSPDGVYTMKVDLRDDKEKGKEQFKDEVKDITKEDENVDIMIKFRALQTKYSTYVEEFQRNVASIDSNTAQIIEFNKQKAQNMSKSYQSMDKKSQSLYQARVGQSQQPAQNSDKANKLRDMIYTLDQKIASIEKEFAEFQSTGEMVTNVLEEDHQNKVQITQKHIEKAFDPVVGDLVQNDSVLPVSYTTIFFIFILIIACVFIATHFKEWNLVTHILEKEKRKL